VDPEKEKLLARGEELELQVKKLQMGQSAKEMQITVQTANKTRLVFVISNGIGVIYKKIYVA